MKAALVKQVHDVFGPWSGFMWKDTSPQQVLDVWPIKAVYWELTCVLQADWYIIPPTVKGDYVRDVVRHPNYAQIIEKHTKNVVPVDHIPFSDYDVVITLDPILNPPKRTRTLFAYYANEHWDRLYKDSMQEPRSGYDLFLDHMMDAPSALRKLPQPLAFPYVHDPAFTRSQFCTPRKEIAWADHRVLFTLAGRWPGELAHQEADAAAARLRKILDIEIRCRAIRHTNPWGVYDPPCWDDSARYYRDLAECKYYIAVGNMAGAGQGLAEAAAMGCLSIGQTDRTYHRLLCHPSCLCEDIAEMPKRFAALRNSSGMWKEVLEFQDAALNQHFLKRPLELLGHAVEMKRKSHLQAQAV